MVVMMLVVVIIVIVIARFLYIRMAKGKVIEALI